VIIECNNAEEWFKDKQQQQNALPKSANPVLLSSDVKKKTEFLDRYIEFPYPSGHC
jgi:heat shock protein 4